MSNEVKPLDLARILGKARNRINLVGVELEGGWRKPPEGVQLVHDGSIQNVGAVTPTGTRERLHVGELPSAPMEVKNVPAWIKAYYPTSVNASCGLHVHMSFKSAYHYERLMEPEYPKTIQAYLIEWAKEEKLPETHAIWERLSGKNRFCLDAFAPDQQANNPRKIYDHDNPGNRYSMINYCHALHGTLECRVLPMMETPAQAVRAVQRVLDVTNACLVAIKAREQKLRTEVTIGKADELATEYIRTEVPNERRSARFA